MKNPLDISYQDLIKEEQRLLEVMKKSYPSLVSAGSMTSYNATHRIACHEQLLKLLRKQEKNRQLSLGELFEKGKS